MEILNMLLRVGGDLGCRDREGRTVLHLACSGRTRRREGLARAMLMAGANPSARDAQGETPLHLRCSLPVCVCLVCVTYAHDMKKQPV